MVRQSGNCNVHVASIRCHTGTMNLFHVNSQTTIIATTYAYYGCTLDNHEFDMHDLLYTLACLTFSGLLFPKSFPLN